MPASQPPIHNVYWAFRLPDEGATGRLGLSLGQTLQPGDHLALTGGLGAGKTTLCRHVAAGFGVTDLSQVASPTYAYAHTYSAVRASLHHLDFYRLDDAESAYVLGLDEILADPGGTCLIEWADRVPELIAPGALWLQLTRHPQAEGRDGTLALPANRTNQVIARWPEDIRPTPVSAPLR